MFCFFAGRFANFGARASSSLIKSFLVHLKVLLVIVTFGPDVVSSWRQLLNASSTFCTSVAGSMSSISHSTMGVKCQKDPLSPTTSEKSEFTLPLSFLAHLTLIRRSLRRVFLIPWIVAPSFSGFIGLLRLFKMAAWLSSTVGFIITASERARLYRSGFIVSDLRFFFRRSFLAGTFTHSSSFLEVLDHFSSGFLAAVAFGFAAGSLSCVKVKKTSIYEFQKVKLRFS